MSGPCRTHRSTVSPGEGGAAERLEKVLAEITVGTTCTLGILKHRDDGPMRVSAHELIVATCCNGLGASSALDPFSPEMAEHRQAESSLAKTLGAPATK